MTHVPTCDPHCEDWPLCRHREGADMPHADRDASEAPAGPPLHEQTDRDGGTIPSGEQMCGRGVCAAPEGHEGTCAEASGWAEDVGDE